MDDVVNLLKNNKMIKVVAPSGSGKTVSLAKKLGSFNYDVKVITKSDLSKIKFPNVEYLTKIDLKNWKGKSNKILILDELETVDYLIIISEWMRYEQSIKIILTSLVDNFPYIDSKIPTFYMKRRESVQIRYTKDVSNKDLKQELFKLINDLNESTIEGDFLIFGPKIEHNITNRKVIFINNPRQNLETTNFGCIIDTMRDNQGYITKEEAILRSNKSLNSVIVYRMISYDSYKKLSDKKDIPLHHLIIDIYNKNGTPIFLENFSDIYSILLNFGILDISKNVTPLGNMIRKLPFSLKSSILALDSFESLVLASLIDNYKNSPFLFNKDTDSSVSDYQIDSDIFIRDNYDKFRGESDCETFLYMYIDSLKSNLKQWCNENKISYKYMKSVYKTIENANKILKYEKKEIDVEVYIRKIKPLISKLSDRMILNEEKTVFTQYIDSNGIPYSIDSLSINLIEEKRPLEIFSIISSEVNNLKSVTFSYVSTLEYQDFEKIPIDF